MRSSLITAPCIAILLMLMALEGRAQGQQGSGSPYSAYGFGDLFNSTQITQALMGVSGVATADPLSVAQINPASYVGLTRPVFEAGGIGRFTRYEMDGDKRKGQRTDFLGLSIGVPFGMGKWGFALGVNPVSEVGYKITSGETLPTGEQVIYQYTGGGGMSSAYIGLGHTLWQSNDTLNRGKKLTFGANLNYLFGSVEELRKVYFPPRGGYYNTSAGSVLTVRSPTTNLGLQYTADLYSREKVAAAAAVRRDSLIAKDKRAELEWIDQGKDPKDRKPLKLHNRPAEALRFRIGVAGDIPVNLRAKNTVVVNTFTTSALGVEFPVDTTLFQQGAKGTVSLPASLNAGVSVFNSRWLLTAEFRMRDWSKVSVNVDGFNERSELGTQVVYALGGSYRPAGEGRGNFWQRNFYRAGVRYSDDYVIVGGTQLRDRAVTGGFSIPLTSLATPSRLSIGAEWGQRGDTADGLIRERYTNLLIGISITPEGWDQWFKKSRID